MSHDRFLDLPKLDLPTAPGQVSITAPSNIALVKYWGKESGQIPKNASISFTLKECLTRTTLSYTPIDYQEKQPSPLDGPLNFEVYVSGVLKPEFGEKIETFFQRIRPYVPWIDCFSWRIDTENTFPHGSGIASSASGFAALAGALMELEAAWNPSKTPAQSLIEKTSFLARLGSGSASRSIVGPMMYWGQHPNLVDSSDLFAVTLSQNLAPVFLDYQDTILLIDKGEKAVSSTVGHNLMHDHPFASQRFAQAQKNLEQLLDILNSGDLMSFCQLVESEALSLHAMMMTSNPSFVLMKPNTLTVIERIRAYRKAREIPVCFTLDAGANVHLLYPSAYVGQVLPWIKEELSVFCQNGQFIEDRVGTGVKII
jgi:diphosphomevalonate decarboxylase